MNGRGEKIALFSSPFSLSKNRVHLVNLGGIDFERKSEWWWCGVVVLVFLPLLSRLPPDFYPAYRRVKACTDSPYMPVRRTYTRLYTPIRG